MTVIVGAPCPGDTRSSTADWLELQALVSPRRRASGATLTNPLDIAQEENLQEERRDPESGELLDEAILEDDRNELFDDIADELQYRESVLGAAYPFKVATRPFALEFPGRGLTQGQVVYLFCLLASAIRENRLQPTHELADIERRLANVFQICSCLAAGGYCLGEVASFGFPRATGLGFLAALRVTYERFKAGVVISEIPDGLPQAVKDGGIDIIAWRDHPDGMPSKFYLVGQCASGKRWKDKSVVDYIGEFHGGWFTRQPAKWVIPAMFIPFTAHSDLEPGDSSFAEALKNYFWFHEMRLGVIFDRVRIAHYAQSLSEAGGAQANVDGLDKLNEIETWVGDTLKLLGHEA